MNTSSGNPFNYSSAMAKNNGLMPNSSSRMALDNLLRRELKVSDPNDAKQIAEALLNRYKNNPRAVAINKEAEGVPFLLASGTPMPLQQAPTSSDAEMQQAINDVERDLQELTTNSILKDVTPELEGWAMAVRSAIQEGVNSARFALDPRQRDKTFGIRRTLGDYARLARLVGALTPTMSLIYRKFAQSLDEVASVLFVMMGEALSNVGFGGRYLLQAPYSELQVRRDAVIYALRNLVGATQEAYAPNEWPRGIDAYRQLFQRLEEQGQGDLRALLVEGELSRVMDALIQRSGQGSVAGLRQLGATAQLDVERLRRLVIVGKNLIYPAAPPLTAFLEALQLFVDGFEPSGGFRLLRIARPPILFYGLYGMSAFDEAEERANNPAAMPVPIGTAAGNQVTKLVEKQVTEAVASKDEAAKESAIKATNNLLNDIGASINSPFATKPDALKDVANFIASPAFGQLVAEGKVSPEGRTAAARVLQISFQQPTIQAVNEKLNAPIMTLAKRGSASGPSGLTAKDVVAVEWSGSGIRFVPKTDNPNIPQFEQMAYARELQSAERAINSLIRQGAHLTGSTNYKQA